MARVGVRQAKEFKKWTGPLRGAAVIVLTLENIKIAPGRRSRLRLVTVENVGNIRRSRTV